jgi:hypothetical protein
VRVCFDRRVDRSQGILQIPAIKICLRQHSGRIRDAAKIVHLICKPYGILIVADRVDHVSAIGVYETS